jgi:hypothetical protein
MKQPLAASLWLAVLLLLAGCRKQDTEIYRVTSYNAADDSFIFSQGNLEIHAKCDEAGGCGHLSGIVGMDVTLDRGSQHVFLRNGKTVGEMFLIQSITNR